MTMGYYWIQEAKVLSKNLDLHHALQLFLKYHLHLKSRSHYLNYLIQTWKSHQFKITIAKHLHLRSMVNRFRSFKYHLHLISRSHCLDFLIQTWNSHQFKITITNSNWNRFRSITRILHLGQVKRSHHLITYN